MSEAEFALHAAHRAIAMPNGARFFAGMAPQVRNACVRRYLFAECWRNCVLGNAPTLEVIGDARTPLCSSARNAFVQ